MSKHVVVAGSLHLDFVVHAESFPVADEYLPGHSPRHVPGGKGGNQAVACARNGVTTFLAGRVGDDGDGRVLIDNLTQSGVDTSLIQVGQGEATGASVAIVNPYGDFGAVVISGANQGLDATQVTIPDGTGYLVLQNELPEETNVALAQMAADSGVSVMLNACPARPLSARLAGLSDVLVLGQVEAERLAGRPFSNVRLAIETIGELTGRVGKVAIMLGAGGVVHMEAGGRAEYSAATETQPQSMLGALDFFVGALASQMASGSAFDAAVHYAQAAATLFVATPPERRDMIRAVQIRARLGEDER
jgi:ribokinase